MNVAQREAKRMRQRMFPLIYDHRDQQSREALLAQLKQFADEGRGRLRGIAKRRRSGTSGSDRS